MIKDRRAFLLFLILLFYGFGLFGYVQYGIISTFIGPQMPMDDAPAITQAIDSPVAVAVDGSGGFYISSMIQDAIYRVLADGSIRTIAGIGANGSPGDNGKNAATPINAPNSMTVDAAGNLYVVDTYNNRIYEIATTGLIVTVAGNGTSGYSGDEGPALEAQLNEPMGVAVDSGSNLYIADTNNHRIRKITSAGIITTVAGNGTRGFSGDGGPAKSAQLNEPMALEIDAKGDLYFADSSNNRIRKIDHAGIITTIAGNGTYGFSGDGGSAIAAQLAQPMDVAIDLFGNLYIADTNNYRIRKVAPTGIITTIGGIGTLGFINDGGMATKAAFQPAAISIDSFGELYIADKVHNRIRKIAATGIITTAAGNGTSGNGGHGSGTNEAMLHKPTGITVAGGELYIADTLNDRVIKVTLEGTIATVAGNGTAGYGGDGGVATKAKLHYPSGVVVDSMGNLYIGDYLNHRIRKVTPKGIITTVAGNGISGFGGDGGMATKAQLSYPSGVMVDTANNFYIADTGNHRVRKVTPGGIITTIAGNGTYGFGGDGMWATEAQLDSPYSLTVDLMGNLYVADSGNNRIRKITPAGIVNTIAGNGEEGFSGDCGPAINAKLKSPQNVTIDTEGNLYIADTCNNRIRRVTSAGTIDTVAGNGDGGFRGDGDLARKAWLNLPTGVTVDSMGNLFIADTGNHRIRKVSPLGFDVK
jgi:trimeric autotransporter adhesin